MSSTNCDLLNLFTTQPATIKWAVDYNIQQTSRSAHEISPEFHPPNNENLKFRLRLSNKETLTNNFGNGQCTVIALNMRVQLDSRITKVLSNLTLTQMKQFKLELNKTQNKTNTDTNVSKKIDNDFLVYHRLALIDEKGFKCCTQEGRSRFDQDLDVNMTKYGAQFVIKNDYLQNEANGLLVDGKLTIFAEIYLLNDKGIAGGFNGNPSLVALSQNYQSLFESGSQSDVTLVITSENKEFPAHKLILSTRSVVFAAMFSHDLVESKQNRVEITDMSAEVCRAFLQYIYTGKVDSIEQNAAELYAAAEKYQVESLKTICAQHLAMAISLDSLENLLLLAELYSMAELKANCIEYLTRHITEIDFDTNWKALTKGRPELAFQLFQIISDKIVMISQ